MTTETTEAPAGAATETVSAERVAADSGDVSAFLEASRGRRAGHAPEKVTRPRAVVEQSEAAVADGAAGRPVVAGRDGAAAKGPKPADREADERLATRVREAVDTATAESTRRIRELEEQIAATRQPPRQPERAGTDAAAAAKPAERKALTSAQIKAYQAQPDAPKLDDKDASGAFVYETSQEHAVALAEYIREARTAEAATETRTRTEHVERVKREHARVATFQDRVETFKRENAAILVDNGKGGKTVPLSPEVAGLHGFGQLHQTNTERASKGLAPLPATVDHAIAEELYDSEIPMQVGRFLSEHPEELAALRAAQTTAQLTRLFGGLEARVRAAAPATATPAAGAGTKPTKSTIAESRREAEEAVDRSVSSARPLNGGNLGRAGAGSEADPEATAVEKQDYAGFAETQRARRLELLQGRQGRR